MYDTRDFLSVSSGVRGSDFLYLNNMNITMYTYFLLRETLDVTYLYGYEYFLGSSFFAGNQTYGSFALPMTTSYDIGTSTDLLYYLGVSNA